MLEVYREILIKDLIFIAAAVVIAVCVSVVGIVLTKKLKSEKIFYYLCSALMIFSVAVGGYYINNLTLDLKYNSFETYVGAYDCPSRDTLILKNGENKKLFAAVSVPKSNGTGKIIYSKRSEIVVDFIEE